MKLSESQSAALDWARGISAQMVLVGHVFSPRLQIQILGVTIFFLLSGFLITHTTLRKGEGYTFTDFLIDRGARIFVPYVPAIAFIVIVGLAFGLSGPYDIGTIAANLLMLEDFPLYRFVHWLPEIDRVGAGRPLWSVAMEWWIYMGFAAVAFYGRIPRYAWPLIAMGLFVWAFNASAGLLSYTWALGALVAVFFWRWRPPGAARCKRPALPQTLRT
jgi:peptidoglycan/LPS O-acetylase OafA/YrhL